MPPRKKIAVKKPSPRAKAPEAKEASPAIAEERVDPAVEAPPAAVAVKKEPGTEGAVASPAAGTSEAEIEAAEEEESREAAAAVPEKGEEEASVEKVREEATVEKGKEKEAGEMVGKEGEGGAGEEVAVDEALAAPEISTDAKEADDGEDKMDADEDAVFEEESGEGTYKDTAGGGANDSGKDGVDELNDADDSGSDDNDADIEEDEEDDPSLYMKAPMTERKKQKEFEIFIGGLHKEAVDEDLIKVFGVFGEIQSVRIVKNPSTQKSKGFAFIRYTSVEHAKKALAELKDGTEVRGKRVGISASQDNDTLYLGNICKTWAKEHVLEALKGFGIEQIEHIHLPEDPKNEGRTKGFAFIEFSSHADAMAAFQRLRKPDAVLGRDRSAKVAFAPTPIHPSEEAMLQVKTVYLEVIPVSWDEEKIEEICKQYGEIEKVQLFRKAKTTKKKDFAFVEFSSREGAVACVEGMNNAQFGEGEDKVKADLAKPLSKGRLAKQGTRGGFKIKKDGEISEEPGQLKKKKGAKLKQVLDDRKAQPKSQTTKARKQSKPLGKGPDGKNHPQTVKSFKGKKRGGRGKEILASQRPSKRARQSQNYGYLRARPSDGFSSQRSNYSGQPAVNYLSQPARDEPRYAPPTASYQAYASAGASGPVLRHSDLEPHAGYLSAVKQVHNPYGYEQRRAGAYDGQARSSSHHAAATVTQTSYPGYSSYAGYEAGYAYPGGGYASSGTYPAGGSYGSRRPYY